MTTLVINNLVDDTSTNLAGSQLYSILDKHFATDGIIEIDLYGSPAISSSFFNSSFGRLIEENTFSTVVKRLKFKNVSINQRRLLKAYFDTYKGLSVLAKA